MTLLEYPALPERVPLPLRLVADRLRFDGTAANVQAAFDRMAAPRFVVQDFVPMAEALEWELSNLAWTRSGVLPFADEQVPYAVTNDGQLSAQAAGVLFANCVEHDPGERLTVLEVGAGTGLFARYFLDAFRDLCRTEERDFFDRLRYVVTDGARRTVLQWEERNVFDGHARQAITGICDAQRFDTARTRDGAPIDVRGVRAVFANYLLDTLPSAVVRMKEHGPEQLCCRTMLPADAAALKRATRLSPEEIRELAVQAECDRTPLLPLLNVFEVDARFLTATDLPPYADEAWPLAEPGQTIILNYGALRCLDEIFSVLDPAGFAIINDYVATNLPAETAVVRADRFGPTSCLPLNFELIEAHAAARGWRAIAPPRCDLLSLCPRMVRRQALPASEEVFNDWFDGERQARLDAPSAAAREHALAGRLETAVEWYRLALAGNPRDWRLLGEVAELATHQLHNPADGLELGRAALELNPWYSPWLWNVVGDALFLLGRTDEAHEALQQARRIAPHHVRTLYGLAFTHAARTEHGDALAVIAAALAADGEGVYRQHLLTKQERILRDIETKSAAERERMAQRWRPAAAE